MSASAVHKAIASVWASSALNAAFKSLWASGVADDYPSLHDQEAAPGQPWPYCVFEQLSSATVVRMSGGTSALREVRDVGVRFHVHAAEVEGDDRSAKEIAADLVDSLMAVFGGHPSTVPTPLTIDDGQFLIAQYQTDYPIRTSDKTCEWIVDYLLRVDVPVAV